MKSVQTGSRSISKVFRSVSAKLKSKSTLLRVLLISGSSKNNQFDGSSYLISAKFRFSQVKVPKNEDNLTELKTSYSAHDNFNTKRTVIIRY